MTQIDRSTALKQLYDQDFALWVEAIAAHLKARDTTHLDWDNLIEEVESLGKSQKKELKSRLGVLLIHILKRCYLPMPECYRGWVSTIDEQRRELQLLLEQSPSLRRYFVNEFDDVWVYALRQIRKDYPGANFPDLWQFNRDVDAILSDEFWQSSGLIS
ncbi:MAG: DUF29 domain-containing protein [Cyanobacteria bacterium CRU_2_1]|nr:DUF29 domain-containing protein [Cyanobacteria bacterium RU_5_0]NJR59052.1 DUF29 domain-containing protein [Cyanobacteria bacterium CRU_2_1]